LAGSLLSRDVVEEGQWVESVLTGKWTYPDGRTLEGEFRKGAIYNGHGVLRHGSQYTEGEGQWVGGQADRQDFASQRECG
jgi:hypothetical protein